MTPAKYAKIKSVADDPRGDPATRAAAQKQVEKWRIKMEGMPLEKKLHPGMVQSEEYKRWAKAMEAGYRGRKR